MSDAKVILDHADIQGNILRPYGFKHGGYLFVAVRDPAAGRRWLGGLRVTTAAQWPPGSKPDVTLNLGVSAAGLAVLGLPPWRLATFGDAFRQGMRARADHLGDVGPSAPERWDAGLREDCHVVLIVHACSGALAVDRMGELRKEIVATGGVEVVGELECANLAEQREHFGFGDGFGQPAIEGSGHEHLPGQGLPMRGGRWRPLKAGEFILGYPDEDSGRPDVPASPFGVNGSYMVLRKLEQNVPLFRKYLKDAARAHGLTPARVAASMVGRWPDGTPLALAPDGPDPAISNVKTRINDFRYHDDPEGRACPIGAHVRRTNPRDAIDPQGRLSLRHRMIRRGMPYGDPLPEGGTDTASRGLVFVCYAASIERQFEDVQREWCNDGDGFRTGLDRDFISGRPHRAGERPNKLLLAGRNPVFLEQPAEPFVVTKGGEYFFAPGVTALRALAGGAW